MSESILSKRYFVSGIVQGVGFRYFAQDVAERLRVAGYARNLPDGRVEVYAVGSAEQLAAMRKELESGPRFASVTGVVEEVAEHDPKWTNEFVIAHGG